MLFHPFFSKTEDISLSVIFLCLAILTKLTIFVASAGEENNGWLFILEDIFCIKEYFLKNPGFITNATTTAATRIKIVMTNAVNGNAAQSLGHDSDVSPASQILLPQVQSSGQDS